MAEIISIHIARQRKTQAEPRESVTVLKNYGIEGDYRSGKHKTGQVTLIEAETIENVARTLGTNIPGGTTRRQIVVKGIKLNDMVGHKLHIGTAILLAEERCNPCDNMERTIGTGARNAMNGKGGIRCYVIKSGEIKVGDNITIEKTCCPHITRLKRFPYKLINYIQKRINT